MCCQGTHYPPELDAAKVKRAVDAAFEPGAAMTAAFVVTWKGRLIGERYGDGITAADAARELVDGQEPDGHADGHPHQAGCL